MKPIIPAEVRAILGWSGRAEGDGRRARLLLTSGNLLLVAMSVALPLAIERWTTDRGTLITSTLWVMILAIVSGFVLLGLGQRRCAPSRWLLLRPVSTISLVNALFLLPCGAALLLLLLAYSVGVASGVFERGILHGYTTVLALVLTPAALGLIGFGSGAKMAPFLAIAVVTVGALGATVCDCPLSINVHIWTGLCLSVSIVLGYGLSFVGVSRMRRGACSSGLRIKSRRVRRVVLRTRARPPFASAEAAETWRQWRRAWFALPLCLIGMFLFALAMVGFNMLMVRILGEDPRGDNSELVGGSAILGIVLGALFAGLLAVSVEAPQRWLVLRSFPASAHARSLFRGATQAIGLTSVLAVGMAVLWDVGVSNGAAVRAMFAMSPFDLVLLVAYGLLAVWAATWALLLVNWVVICVFGIMMIVGNATIFYNCICERMYGAKEKFAEVLFEAVVYGLFWVLAVALPFYGARALYLARQAGCVSARTCRRAVCIWLVLVALPLLHCPIWLSQLDLSLRIALTLVVVTCAIAPIGAIPLLCDALKRPGVSLLGWRGYSYTPPIVQKFNGWSERQKQRRAEYR